MWIIDEEKAAELDKNIMLSYVEKEGHQLLKFSSGFYVVFFDLENTKKLTMTEYCKVWDSIEKCDYTDIKDLEEKILIEIKEKNEMEGYIDPKKIN